MTGNLYFLKNKFSVENPKSYTLIRHNPRVENINKTNSTDDLLLITYDFLESLGLKKN